MRRRLLALALAGLMVTSGLPSFASTAVPVAPEFLSPSMGLEPQIVSALPGAPELSDAANNVTPVPPARPVPPAIPVMPASVGVEATPVMQEPEAIQLHQDMPVSQVIRVPQAMQVAPFNQVIPSVQEVPKASGGSSTQSEVAENVTLSNLKEMVGSYSMRINGTIEAKDQNIDPNFLYVVVSPNVDDFKNLDVRNSIYTNSVLYKQCAPTRVDSSIDFEQFGYLVGLNSQTKYYYSIVYSYDGDNALHLAIQPKEFTTKEERAVLTPSIMNLDVRSGTYTNLVSGTIENYDPETFKYMQVNVGNTREELINGTHKYSVCYDFGKMLSNEISFRNDYRDDKEFIQLHLIQVINGIWSSVPGKIYEVERQAPPVIQITNIRAGVIDALAEFNFVHSSWDKDQHAMMAISKEPTFLNSEIFSLYDAGGTGQSLNLYGLESGTDYYAKIFSGLTWTGGSDSQVKFIFESNMVNFKTQADPLVTLEDFAGNKPLYDFVCEKVQSKELKKSALAEIKFLNIIDNNQLESLEGIGNMPNLTNLDLANIPNLKSLKGIEALSSLNALYFRNTPKLSSLKGIENLKEIYYLVTYGSAITSAVEVESLVNLQFLWVGAARLKALPNMTKLSNLKSESTVVDDFGSRIESSYFGQNFIHATEFTSAKLPTQMLDDKEWVNRMIDSQQQPRALKFRYNNTQVDLEFRNVKDGDYSATLISKADGIRIEQAVGEVQVRNNKATLVLEKDGKSPVLTVGVVYTIEIKDDDFVMFSLNCAFRSADRVFYFVNNHETIEPIAFGSGLAQLKLTRGLEGYNEGDKFTAMVVGKDGATIGQPIEVVATRDENLELNVTVPTRFLPLGVYTLIFKDSEGIMLSHSVGMHVIDKNKTYIQNIVIDKSKIVTDKQFDIVVHGIQDNLDLDKFAVGVTATSGEWVPRISVSKSHQPGTSAYIFTVSTGKTLLDAVKITMTYDGKPLYNYHKPNQTFDEANNALTRIELKPNTAAYAFRRGMDGTVQGVVINKEAMSADGKLPIKIHVYDIEQNTILLLEVALDEFGQIPPGALSSLDLDSVYSIEAVDANGVKVIDRSTQFIRSIYPSIKSEAVNPVATAITISGSETVECKFAANATATSQYTATVKDQNGIVMTNAPVVYSLKAPVAGISIAPATGLVTIAGTAVAGIPFTVVATSGTLVAEKEVAVTKENPVATTITLSGAAAVESKLAANAINTSQYAATVKDQNGTVMADAPVVYSLKSPVAGISIAPATGLVTITSAAQAANMFYVVATVPSSATGIPLVAEKAVAITKEAQVATTIEILGAATVSSKVAVNDTSTSQYSAIVKDQTGAVMGNAATVFSLKAPVTGISIAPATGLVTITSTAVAGASFTVVATCGTAIAEKVVAVAKEATVATSIAISGPDTVESKLGANGPNTSQYTAIVKDQNGIVMGNPPLVYSLRTQAAGISIAPTTGLVTITSTPVAGTIFTVVATSGALVAEKVVVVTKEAQRVSEITISGAATVESKLAATVTSQYTATVKDQSGAVMANAPVVFSLKAPVAGITIAPATGLVTITTAAVAGTPFTVVATATTVGTSLSAVSEKVVSVTKEAAQSGGSTPPPATGGGATGGGPISGGGGSTGGAPASGGTPTPAVTEKPVETIKEPVVPQGALDFTDLESVGWAKDAIKALANKGILGGKAAGQFDPSGHITRAEFAAIAVRLLKLETSEKDPGFTDTNASDWFMKEVKTAVANGLLKGADGKFNPNGKMTRQEIATIIGRILLLNKITLKSEAANPAALLKDAASIASWALEGAKLALQEGIITGQETTVAGKKVMNFAPQASATRAEAAVMLYRLAAKVPTNLQ